MTPASDLLTPLSQLEAVCENATVALFVMDEHQHCVYMNAAAQAMTGYTTAEVQGRPLHDFVHHTHPDGRPYPLADCPIDRVAPQGMQEQGEEVFVHRDGHFYPVAFTASPVRRDGSVVGTVIEVREVAHERQRQAEDVAVRALAGMMLTELDLERMVQAVTDTATRLTGAQFGAFFYNTVDAAGGSLVLYALSGVPAERFSHFPHPRATPLFGPTFHGEGTLRIDDVFTDPHYGQWGPHYGLPEGHLPVRSYLAVPVKSDTDEVLGGLFFGHERVGMFTADHERAVESIAAQAAVGISRLRLFRAFEAEAREKERLYREATRANHMKDQFLATISHELRTPLSSILGWSEMLASGRLPPEMVERAISTIDRNARAQAQIIDDLLDISRIVSGKLHLDVRSFDLRAPIEAAVDAVRPAALARDVQLRVALAAGTDGLQGDPDRLQQVVWNLVTNAVKFTDRGGRVEVSTTRNADHVEIRVRDTGRGIDPAFMPMLFDRFSQVDASSTREHGGLGLGLSIVRQLVEMHGGTVEARSDGLGRGAEFTVRLPLPAGRGDARDGTQCARTAPGRRDTRTHPQPGEHALTACRVLLVEDDADTRGMLASVLEAHGARVRACGSAGEALAAVADFGPDLVVSDIGMPGVDGYGFIRMLREWEADLGRAAVPAIALTAYARAEDRAHALEHGFQAHVAKPVQPSELVAIVDALRSWPAPAALATPPAA